MTLQFSEYFIRRNLFVFYRVEFKFAHSRNTLTKKKKKTAKVIDFPFHKSPEKKKNKNANRCNNIKYIVLT